MDGWNGWGFLHPSIQRLIQVCEGRSWMTKNNCFSSKHVFHWLSLIRNIRIISINRTRNSKFPLKWNVVLDDPSVDCPAVFMSPPNLKTYNGWELILLHTQTAFAISPSSILYLSLWDVYTSVWSVWSLCLFVQRRNFAGWLFIIFGQLGTVSTLHETWICKMFSYRIEDRESSRFFQMSFVLVILWNCNHYSCKNYLEEYVEKFDSSNSFTTCDMHLS
jgi:hypothetical protein